MKNLLLFILIIISTLCLAFSAGCAIEEGGGTTTPVEDLFAIDNVNDARRNTTYSLVFSDKSDGKVNYVYDEDLFSITNEKIKVLEDTPNGTYTIKANNAYMEVKFTVTVIGGKVDFFSINSISNANRGSTYDIVFLDSSESAVTYTYDKTKFSITNGKIKVLENTPNGTYTIKATNDYREVSFSITVTDKADIFSIKTISGANRGGSYDIVFSDPSDSAVTYTYDTSKFTISNGKLTVLENTANGTYSVKATNDYMELTFTVIVGNSADIFAVNNISSATRSSTTTITFSDASESAVTYTYDTSKFSVSNGKITVLSSTPNGTYTLKATNDYMEVSFTITVTGENLLLTLSNDASCVPYNLSGYLASGTKVSLLQGSTVVKTANISSSGKVSFEVPNGTYTVKPEGYLGFNVTLNGYLSNSYTCKYQLFSNESSSSSYATNGYINLSSELAFKDSGVVYAEMTIFAPTDIKTTQNSVDIGATLFQLNTDSYIVDSQTKSTITFGGHWNKTYYRLRWGNERWTAIKDFDTSTFNKLIDQSRGVKIAIAIKDGNAYAFMENSNGNLEIVAMTGGQVKVNSIKSIFAEINAKVSDIRYSTSLTSAKIGSSTVDSLITPSTTFALSSGGLNTSGSSSNGYTVTGATSGTVSKTSTNQNGYYNFTSNGLITFDFNYTVNSSSRYFPTIRFNDSIDLQMCVWDGLLTLKYNNDTVAQNSYFNNGNKSGSFTATIAIHADEYGSLAIYLLKDSGEVLLFTTYDQDRPFKFSMLKRLDFYYTAESANDWEIANFFVNNNKPTATVNYTSNSYVTYSSKPTSVAYNKTCTIKFTPASNYTVTSVKMDGKELPFTTSNGVISVTYRNVSASQTHTFEVLGRTPIANYQFKTSELSKYKIVYDSTVSEYSTYANTLKNTISSKYGVTLSVGTDKATALSDYEILIGDTNRYSTANGKIMQYSVTIKNGKFRINAGGLFSLDKAMEYITSSILNGTARTLSEGEYYSTSLITTKQAITSGTTARIMTTNALADAFNTDSKYKTAAYRVEIYAGILISHTPDAIGAQELDNAWNNVLDKYLDKVYNETGIRYARQYAKYENKINYTSLIYRSDKYSVGDSGVTVFTWWKNSTINHSYHMRNVTWAQFVSKTNTSKKFILATTHWSYTTEHEDTYGYNTLRVQCKNETNSLLTTLKNKYSMPIFLMGDLNTSLAYFTNSGWLNSSYNVLSSQATSNNTLITKLPTENHFDHIFGTGSYTVKRYDYLTSTNYKNNLSDHPFFYADVAF